MVHKFHIPVLGLGYSIDTPLKVAKYGISSVVSVVDDELIERMRKYHMELNGFEFTPIPKKSFNYRANRITSYLNLMLYLAETQFKDLKSLPFIPGNDLCKYFELLPNDSQLKLGYELMMDYPEGERKTIFQNILKNRMIMGSIDVNIMAKVDKQNFNKADEYLGDEQTDALAALRGFAESKLSTSVILSAGMNPKLYSYISQFSDFFPNQNGELNKRIILKVSDFRSALIQAKFLAKKGLWISEFRIESGLNCGGHAFATEGYLLGPILAEFQEKKEELLTELFELYKQGLQENQLVSVPPVQRITVQGGIGTSSENEFLLKHYGLDATGWGSPFLLVPEVTNVDDTTLQKLANANEDDYYLSNSSPLGILFNNFKGSSIEQQRLNRIEKGRPGSPCTKKYLVSNTEFTTQPICTASREYQRLKINQLETLQLPAEEFQKQFNTITEKVCLCEGLCTSAYLKDNIIKPKESNAVAICPGPNLAYFSKTYTLQEMVNHIYGKLDLLDKVKRPHFFIKELNLYIDYLQKEIQIHLTELNDKKSKQLTKFKAQLLEGVAYYKSLFNQIDCTINPPYTELLTAEAKLANILI